jgi:hypothetical protein
LASLTSDVVVKSYFTSSILYSNVPEGALSFTVSPFFFQSIAFQIGDSFDILGTSARILDSVGQTILYVCFSFSPISRIVTTAHIITLSSFFPLSSLII